MTNRGAYIPIPPKNQRWRIGFRQRLARRAWIANGGKPLTNSELARWVYPRLKGSLETWRYRQIWLSASRWAEPIGRSRKGRGRAPALGAAGAVICPGCCQPVAKSRQRAS